jgi:hypothetical protein
MDSLSTANNLTDSKSHIACIAGIPVACKTVDEYATNILPCSSNAHNEKSNAKETTTTKSTVFAQKKQ